MAKVLTTFTLLKEAIADELDRTDVESAITGGTLPAAVELFIGLCEDELDRHAAIQDERRTQLTVSQEVTTFPTTVKELRSAALNGSSIFGPIEITSINELRRQKENYGSSTGYPRAAAITSDGTELVVTPPPDASYTLEVVYLDKLERLSDTVTSNWVLDQFSDIYLYGSLRHAEAYLKNDDRIQIWERLYDRALAGLAAFIERRRYPEGTLVARVPNRHVIGG